MMENPRPTAFCNTLVNPFSAKSTTKLKDMRLKNAEGGHLSVCNGNGRDVLNSPKRLNTVQNSNVSPNNYQSISNQQLSNNEVSNGTLSTSNSVTDDETIVLNNINNAEVRWCGSTNRELRNNANNRLYNINNTLAVSLSNAPRHRNASSICSESSPDDSSLDYEDAHQSSSSVDASPQEEDRGFDYSDTDSEEGNLNHRKGIVNPNYPGFQHLAHTLDYTIKDVSDSDEEDDYDATDANSLNNNQEDSTSQIESVNRLDSVENIQKVFYEKPVFDICSNANEPEISLNIKTDEALTDKAETQNIIGNFGEEIAREFGRIFEPKTYETKGKATDDLSSAKIFDDLEKSVQRLCNSTNTDSYAPDLFTPTDTEIGYGVLQLLKPKDNKTNLKREPIFQDPFNDSEYNFSKSLQEFEEVFDIGNCSIDDTKKESSFEKEAIGNCKPSLTCFEDNFDPNALAPKQAVQTELEDAAENLNSEKDIQPSASKYKILPNIELPFNKAQSSQSEILEDSKTVSNMNQSIQFQDAFLSGAHDKLLEINNEIFKKSQLTRKDSNREQEEKKKVGSEEQEKFCKEDKTKDEKEKDEDSAVPCKKEKIEVKKRRHPSQQIGSLITIPRRENNGRSRDPMNRRSLPLTREKKRNSPETFGSFDVYNIETAMPKIDMEAIETHLRAAREEERRRRTDREEIRRRLAMGNEDDYYSSGDRPGRKPSLQARLQSGMNLQICFMNETASDTESPSSDSECTLGKPKQSKGGSPRPQPKRSATDKVPSKTKAPPARPVSLTFGQQLPQPQNNPPSSEMDFFARQARLQTEARMALAQAKEMARMQMEIERQRQKKSPITEMVRHSLEKVGIPFPEDRRRLSRQILTDMNVAQLQVIVNDLHTQIEILNENLVKFLMDRDDLHMEQDSMLVDIEDLTRFLGAKEQTLKDNSAQNNNLTAPPSPAPSSPLSALNVKPHLHRIASFVKK